MCHFITATLPSKTDRIKAAEVFARYKLGFQEIENGSVREHLEPGDIYILTTLGGCDCGTVLGSEQRVPKFTDEETARFRMQTIDKLIKKGWGKKKIDRWFHEAKLTADKQSRTDELRHESAEARASDWVAFIEDILQSGAVTRIGLLLHYYTGGLSSRLLITGRNRVTLKELSENVLLQMSEDVIYEFVAD